MKENLIYVLAKVQFGRITESRFKDRSDAVQESLRKNYPIVNDNNTLNTFQIEMMDSSEQKVQHSTEKIINICSSNREWGVRIGRDFVMLQTKNYAGFEDLQERLESLLKLIGEEFDLYHSSFVGLRFVNKYPYDEKDEFRNVFRRLEFIQPDLELKDSLKAGSNLTSHYSIKFNNLRINSGIIVSGVTLPLDLADLPSDLGLTIGDVSHGVWAHLDIDSFYSEADVLNDFSVEDIISKYKVLRGYANDAFSQITYC